MIKVLVWGATDTIGGVEAVLWNYVSHIKPDKIQFDFINTYADISIGDKVRERGSIVIGLPDRKKNYFKYRKRLKKFMKSHAMEYSAVWLNDCMFGNIDILKLAKKYGISKRIVHAHNALNMGGGKSRLFRHKLNSVLLEKYVTDYWACSKVAGEWSYPESIKKAGIIKVIPNAVDIERFAYDEKVRNECRKELGIEDKVVFGHVGRFHFQKNHIFLIDIFSEILKFDPKSVLILIGNGEDEEKVRKKVKEYGIENEVKFLGIRKDVPQLYQAMDGFLLPSLFEGLPVVMIEAQATGLPCFVADTITLESDISGNVCYYSLDLDKNVWAKKIVGSMISFSRDSSIKRVISANGYSIVDAAKRLEQEFLSARGKDEGWNHNSI